MAVAFSIACSAQQSDTIPSSRIITNVKMIGIGATNILDTYISQEKYTGTEVRFISHTTRENPQSPVSRELIHQGYVSSSSNRADNSNFIAGMYTFGYAWHYNWHLLEGRLEVKAGGMVDANLGFLYNTRGGNNSMQAKAYLNVSPSAVAAYRFRLFRCPASVRYEASAPLFGIMFSPAYGQSYYELFTRGNYDHNVVPTTFISTPSLRNMLTLDITLRRTTLRLGYMGDFQQSKVNSLKWHSYSNMFMIGIVKHFKITKIIP